MRTDEFDLAPVHPADASALAALHREVLGETDGWSDVGLRRVLMASAARGLVATSRAAPRLPLGFVVAFAAAGEAEVLALCVAAAHRRQGVARALLRELGKQLATDGISRLHLEVRASNFAARELYARNGFTETGRRKLYYQGTEDAVTMARELSPT